MDMRVVVVVPARRVVGDVLLLRFKISEIADAMLMIAGVPYFAGRLIACSVGIPSFDELYGFRGRYVCRRSDKDVDVVGHDDEGVDEEFTRVAIAEEGGDEEFGVSRALEVAMLLECRDRDGVCLGLLADCGHEKRAYPRG